MNIKNVKYRGNITELECYLAFLKLGYNISIPYGDCERYDFIADVNGHLLKIQCKTSSFCNEDKSSIRFSCRSLNKIDGKQKMHKYSKEEIDFFATSHEGVCYLVPVEECGCDKVIRLLPPKNYNIKGINRAEDYRIEVILKQFL